MLTMMIRNGKKFYKLVFLSDLVNVNLFYFIALFGQTNHRMEMLKMRLFHFLALFHPQWSCSDSELFQIQFWSIYCISNGQSCGGATGDGRGGSLCSPSFALQIINPGQACCTKLDRVNLSGTIRCWHSELAR